MSISAAKARVREESRHPDGRFGNQPHDPADFTLSGEDVSWAAGFDDPEPELETAPEPAPEPEPEPALEPEPGPAAPSERESIRYSFLEEFEAQQERFEQDFDGFPNRFFTADLYDNKYLVPPEDPQHERLWHANFRVAGAQRMLQATSEPSDLRVPDERIEKTARDLGMTDLRRIEDPKVLRDLKLGERGWVGTLDGREVVFGDKSAGSKNCRQYRFLRTPPEPLKNAQFLHLDARSLAGVERVKRRTGVNLLPVMAGVELEESDARISARTDLSRTQKYEHKKEMRALINARDEALVRGAFADLEDAQREGQNFRAQRKYLKDKLTTSSATAWQDKKHPDEIHQQLMRETRLNDHFAKVEVDNDVDPAEFADFERSLDEVRGKLPPIPAGREPVLRVRYLGRHRASGVFFPHANTIAVDVRDSGSYVHEYGHYLDFVAKSNASLAPEFREVVGTYRRNLVVPESMSSKKEYYGTPTEVFARGFELYARERLGVTGSRLLREDRLGGFDYAPFADEEFKQRTFTLFDRVFDKQTMPTT